MIKLGRMALLLLLAGPGMAMVEPVSGSMMGQGMMGQGMMDQNDMMDRGMMEQCAGCNEMMAACPGNMTCMMMRPITGACPANRTCYVIEQVQNASSAQAKLDCARIWLKKAMELHELHLDDPTTTTNESQMELMDQIKRAYECVTGENVTVEELTPPEEAAAAGQAPAGDEHGH